MGLVRRRSRRENTAPRAPGYITHSRDTRAGTSGPNLRPNWSAA
ncbi:hypothetical protein C7S13_8181 [Burkholderia cepacia]|nr:hypothetical protein [Burkholderia cepacia]MDW9246189.1 hypothetical protein [Burkholderia cepacia]